MRAIDLKTVVLATYYKVTEDGIPREVPDDDTYNPETMVRRTFSYRTNIKGIMSIPQQSGQPGVTDYANLDDVRKAVAILTELKNTKEGQPLVLEDGDFNYLVTRVKAAKWPFVDEVILTFVDDVEHTTAMSKERVAAAVAKMEGENSGDDAVRLPSTLTEAAARQPTSIIDVKRNGKSREHSRR